MKALSVKQPWASLIASGIKDIENRSWKTNFRGRIYIHASAAKFKLEYTPLTIEQAKEAYEGHKLGKINDADALPYSAIIGEVDIIDCVINHPSIWADQMITHRCKESGLNILQKGQDYVWNWVLANAVLYEAPIFNVKGKLSFWEFEKY